MAQITWDNVGDKIYETGTDHGVLYAGAGYTEGVAWNGLTGVTESPSGAEPQPQYADNIKYLNIISAEDFGLTIEAFTYPDEFAVCDGSAELTPGVMIGQQDRKTFGFSYRTQIGNDSVGQNFGYKLHLIYGCVASPSEKAYTTINESPEAITFSWEVTTTPVPVTGYKPAAQLTINSTEFTSSEMKTKLTALETILYGTAEAEPRMPLPDEVLTLLGGAAG